MELGVKSGHEPTIQPIIILSLVVAAIITFLAVFLFIAIPSLIPQGGIPGAQTDFQTLSPIFFPRLTFALLAVLGLSYFISNVRRLPLAIPGRIYNDSSILPRVLVFFSITVVYALMLPLLGFLIPSMFLMGGGTLFFGTRVWWQVLTFALVSPIIVRFVFERLLAISLPSATIEVIADTEEALMQLLSSIVL